MLGTLLVPFGLGSGVAFWYAARRAGGVRALARRIVRTRREIRGFEDMGTMLDLPPDFVEDVRERAIFLPRG